MKLLFVAIALLGSTALAQETTSGGGAQVHANVPYLEDADYADDKDKLDIYIPAGGASTAPVFIFVHGGALMGGDKQSYEGVGRRFAGEGFVSVVVNHRLSPGVVHPAHIEDIAASFAWVHANISKYGGDPARIFVAGHSSGAYLVALLALDSRYLAAHGLAPNHMKAVIPISGFFHVDRIAPGRPKTVWGNEEATWLEASPSRYVNAGTPPTLLLYADGDVAERQQESEDLAAELKAKGHTSVRTQQIADRTHSSIVRRLSRLDDDASKAMVVFMRQLLEDGGR